MLGACAVAMLVAIVLRSRPIYDQLAERAAQNAKRLATDSDELPATYEY